MIVFLEALERFSAIKTNGMDMGVLFQQGRKIIASFVVDIGIKASLAFTGGDGIPKGNMMAQQHVQAFCIDRWCVVLL